MQDKNTAYREALARRLRQLRASMTQAELARMLGIAQSTLAGYEKGDGMPSPLVLSRMCSYFGVPAQWLLLGENPPEPRETPALPSWPGKRGDGETMLMVSIPRFTLRQLARRGLTTRTREHAERGVALPRSAAPYPERLWAVEVENTDMAPELMPSDLAVVDISKMEPARLHGKIVLLQPPSAPAVFRRFRVSGRFAVLELGSDQGGDPLTLKLDDLSGSLAGAVTLILKNA